MSWAELLGAPLVTSPVADGVTYDLRTLLGNIPAFVGGAQRAGDDRRVANVDIAVVEDAPAKIHCAPLQVDAVVDGIQSATVMCYRQSRPILLTYTAAGAAVAGPDLAAINETLTIVAAEADRAWVDTVNCGDPALPVATVEGEDPPSVERASQVWVSKIRDRGEKALVADLLAAGARRVVVDGALAGYDVEERLVGVVKTTRTRYLDDEASLYTLPAGWRSAVFTIANPDGSVRHSTYLRLHPNAEAGWDFALVRIETYRRDLIEPACAFALAERQPPGSADARWDRHLTSIAVCEQLLRDRRPPLF